MQSNKSNTRPARIEPSHLTNFQKIQAYLMRKPGAEKLSGKALEQYQRYEQANRLLCDFYTKYEVANQLVTQFGISITTAYEDIRKAGRLFGEVTESSKQALKHQLSEMKMRLARKAYEAGDIEVALKAISGVSKINGLDKEEIQTIDPDQIKPATIVITTNPQALREKANELIADVEDVEEMEEIADADKHH